MSQLTDRDEEQSISIFVWPIAIPLAILTLFWPMVIWAVCIAIWGRALHNYDPWGPLATGLLAGLLNGAWMLRYLEKP